MPIYIGLEAHDGTGKSTNSGSLLELFNGQGIERTKAMRKKEKDVFSRRDKEGLPLQAVGEEIDQAWRDETISIKKETAEQKSNWLVILDRTWISHAAEQLIQSREQNVQFEHELEGGEIAYPEGVLQPSLTFELFISEERRDKQVTNRDEELSERDIRLRDDSLYREDLEQIRKKLGCVRLSLRERDKGVAALRAAQVLLGHPSIPPLGLKPGVLDFDSNP